MNDENREIQQEGNEEQMSDDLTDDISNEVSDDEYQDDNLNDEYQDDRNNVENEISKNSDDQQQSDVSLESNNGDVNGTETEGDVRETEKNNEPNQAARISSDKIGGDKAGGDVKKRAVDTGSGMYVEGDYIVYQNPSPTEDRFQGRDPDDLASYQAAKRLRAYTQRAASNYGVDVAAEALASLIQVNFGNIRQTDEGPTLRQLTGDWLRDVVRQFVVFDSCEQFAKELHEKRLVVLQGNDELLVSQLALWLMFNGLEASLDLEPFPAFNVNMRNGLIDFAKHYPHQDDLQGVWYIAQSVPENTFSGISSQLIEQIQSNLRFADSYLIVTVKPDTSVPRAALRSVYKLVDDRPEASDVLISYIQNENLSAEEKQALLKQLSKADGDDRWRNMLRQQLNLKDIYALAENVISLWQSSDSKDLVTIFFAEYQTRQLENWFKNHKSWQDRAYILTLAVLDGALPNEIDEAYNRLLKLWGLESPEKRPRLSDMLAGQRSAYEFTEAGPRRIKVNGFETPGFYGLVLYHIWDELYRENDPKKAGFLLWLKELAIQKNDRIRQLTARAIGTLSDEYFYEMEKEIISPLIKEGAINSSTGNMPALLQLVAVFLIPLMPQNPESEGEQKTNKEFQLLIQRMFELAEAIDGGFREARGEAFRYFDVLGSILAYGVESGNQDYRNEVLTLVTNLTNIEERNRWIEDAPEEIQREFLEFLKKINEGAASLAHHFLTQPDNIIGHALVSSLNDAIKTSLIVYQQSVGTAVHFYSGGHIVNRVCQDLKRLTSKRNKKHVTQLGWAIRTAIRGTVRKRLNLPGDPMPDIEMIVKMVTMWLREGHRFAGSKRSRGDLSHKLFLLGLDVFADLSVQVTEPYTQVDETAGNTNRRLLKLDYTDWPLAMFLSLYSDEYEDFVTQTLRYLISRNRTPVENTQWADYMIHYLDTPKPRGKLQIAKPAGEWTLRDLGYGLLEYWMLFAVGRNDGQKPSIHRVDDIEAYITHLNRIVLGVLAWHPGRKTRQRLVNRLKKLSRRKQTVHRIAGELSDYIDNYTNESGHPLS